MAQLKHFDLPFRLVGSDFATVQQDSTDDVKNCVETVLRYRIGFRPERMDFGIPDPTFSQQLIPTNAMEAAVLRWEPRAHVAFTSEIGDDSLSARIRTFVSGGRDD